MGNDRVSENGKPFTPKIKLALLCQYWFALWVMTALTKAAKSLTPKIKSALLCQFDQSS